MELYFKSGEDGFSPSPQRALFHQEIKQEFMERKDRTKELELDLLLAENKQLRAKVSLLTFEKQSALNMYNQERKRNQVFGGGGNLHSAFSIASIVFVGIPLIRPPLHIGAVKDNTRQVTP